MCELISPGMPSDDNHASACAAKGVEPGNSFEQDLDARKWFERRITGLVPLMDASMSVQDVAAIAFAAGCRDALGVVRRSVRPQCEVNEQLLGACRDGDTTTRAFHTGYGVGAGVVLDALDALSSEVGVAAGLSRSMRCHPAGHRTGKGRGRRSE